MAFPEPAEERRQKLLRPFLFRLWLFKTLPLAAAAGLRLLRLSEDGCAVALPGGWRTQNPFRSTYFAAQAMAAEMSTGAVASLLVLGHPASVSMLVTGLRATFTKKIVGESRFVFEDVAGMRDAVRRTVANGEPTSFVARSVGRTASDEVAAEFEITWSFKRRASG